MENEVVMYCGAQALIEPKRMDYEVVSPMTGNRIRLKRDTDFGVIKGTKKPSLYKAGAEKVIAAYGMLQRYSIESKIEQPGQDPFFMYTVRCDLVRVGNDGREYVFTSGIGSANTKEKRNGFNGAYDAANSTLKMAQKRAMVSAAVNIGALSSAFSMDIEDMDFVEGGYKTISNTQDPKSHITAAQTKRLFAIANNAGLNAAKAKERLAILGYTKATELTQEKYDDVCQLMAMEDEEFKKATAKEKE